MAMVEKHVKTPARSGPAESHHGSMRHSDIRRLMGEGGAKAAPAVKQRPAAAKGGSPASEGQNAVAHVTKQVKR
jgi:hypothetical protein